MSISRRGFVGKVVAGSVAASLAPALSVGQDREPPTTVHDDIRAAAGAADLALQFDGRGEAECRQWQGEFRDKLKELLGPVAPPATWATIEVSRVQQPDHWRYELELLSPGLPPVPCYLLVPLKASAERPVPGVLCVHGHGDFGHHPIVGRTDIDGVAASIQTANYDYGLRFVRRGYAVIAPCMTPFGDRVDRTRYGGNDPCGVTFVRMQALGQLLIAANIRDLRWALSVLAACPEVDSQRLGCLGLSYGGRMTMMTAALDTRVRVAAISGALNLLQERIRGRYSCGAQIIPGLLRYGDYSEIGGLIAPRPCVWEAGTQDKLIVPGWSGTFRERLERVWRALDASRALQFDEFDGGHRWNGAVAEPLFDQVLRPHS